MKKCIAVCAAVAAAVAGAAGAGEFRSVRAAAAGFATNTVERQSAAIEYVSSAASGAKSHQSAAEAVSTLREMCAARGDEELFEKSCREFASSGNVFAARAAMSALASAFEARGDGAGAGRMLLGMLECAPVESQGVARRLVSAGAPGETLEKALLVLRDAAASAAGAGPQAVETRFERVQPEIVELLSFLGRHDEALAECRVWMLLGTQRSYQRAVEMAADVMRCADRNLGRAEAFVKFHEKGVVPDGLEPLFAPPRLSDAARLRERAALAKLDPKDWNACLSACGRAFWADDPETAVSFAVRAFALAPFDERSLQRCADAVARPFMVATRDPAVGKGVAEYLASGRGEDPVALAGKILRLKEGGGR